MAKRKLTVEGLRDYLENKLIDELVAIDDKIAEEFEIDCWDMCLDGKDWNATLSTLTDMYVKAIISDRDWESKADKKYAVTIDLTKHLKKMELERKIRTMKRELEELE